MPTCSAHGRRSAYGARRVAHDETHEEKHDEKDEAKDDETPDYRMIVTRLMRLEAAVGALTAGTGVSALSVADAAVKAASQVAIASGKMNAHVESVASDLAARLTEQVESTFKSAIETGLENHTLAVSEKMSAVVDERLSVARSTHESLEALRSEMAMVNKSLTKEIEGDLTPSKLPRHSILNDFK